MEDIRWVTTPPCALCTPTAEQKRRLPCRGCTKQPPRPPETTGAKRRLRTGLMRRRDRKVLALRQKGLTLSEIGSRLSMPRSTVNNALARCARAGGVLNDSEGSPAPGRES